MVLAVSARAVVLVVPGVLVVPACPVAVLVVPLVVHVHVSVLPLLPVLPVLRVLRVLDQPRMDLDPMLMVAMDLAPINGIFGDLKVGLVVRISASCYFGYLSRLFSSESITGRNCALQNQESGALRSAI